MGAYLEHTLYDVANDACDIATADAQEIFNTLRGGRKCFYPIVTENDEVGIGVNPEYHYLVYLENGFASFPMKALYGKTIPMLIGGRIVFRKCTGINQFRPGHRNYWQRDINGELVPEYKQRRAWVHPGFGPTHFMAKAVDEAMEQNQEDIDNALVYDAYEELEEDIDRRYYR